MSDSLTRGVCLRFYLGERDRHGSRLAYEWLLDEAQRLDLPGGSAFRAIAGFGRSHRLHEQRFFELAGDCPLLLVFELTEAQEAALLERLRGEGFHAFYTRSTVEYGMV